MHHTRLKIALRGSLALAGIAASLILGMASDRPAHAQDSAPAGGNMYSAYSASYFVPYAGCPPVTEYPTSVASTNESKEGCPASGQLRTVKAEFAGRKTVNLTIDTGSTGIAVARKWLADPMTGALPEGPNLINTNIPGYIYYNSSKKLETGTIYLATLTFIDGVLFDPNNQVPGQPFPQAKVPILVVDTLYINEKGADGTYTVVTDKDPQTAMMGVGFSRWSSQMPNGMAAANTFLNLNPMRDNLMRPGYVLTRTGVYLGLIDPITTGFTFGQIQPGNPAVSFAELGSEVAQWGFKSYLDTLKGGAQAFDSPSLPTWLANNGYKSSLPEWQPLPGCVQVTGAVGNFAGCGQVLMDTGVEIIYVAVPNGPPYGTLDLTQNTVSVSMLRSDSNDPASIGTAQAAFSFGKGVTGGIPIESKNVHLYSSGGATSYVNSSVWSHAIFDYLVDGTGGFVGLRPTGHFPGGSHTAPAK